MEDKRFNYHKIKKIYLKFLTSQEVMSEPFRDKLGQLNKFYLPISKMIAEDYLEKKKTKVIGLTGGQGTGKSTISNILKIILKEAYKLETVIFSIDDFYKTLSERKKISKKISPLFLTRGVPGTHDTKMLLHLIKILKNDNFKRMISDTSYKILLNSTKFKIRLLDENQEMAKYSVDVDAYDNKRYNLSWVLERAKLDQNCKNCWMTTSVTQPQFIGQLN